MNLPDLTGCAGLAGLVTLLLLCSRCRAPLGADEGYLWFGVQQLLRGRLPHRDFKSYEPGRYLWLGLLSPLFGRGLPGLRIGTHLFFALALAWALWTARRYGLAWPALAAMAVALAALAHPQHKQFEHGWILAAWAANAQALLLATPASLAAAAACVGLSLLFGFNLFLYFGAALATTLLLAAACGWLSLDLQACATLAIAGSVAALPFLLFLLSPGFRRRFQQRRIRSVLVRGESNLSLPLPWPWRKRPWQLQGLDASHGRAFQWCFAGLFVVPVVLGGLACLAPAMFDGLAPALLAAAVLGLAVSHHATSRADPPHLTQSMAPACLLALLLAAALLPATAWGVALAAAWLTWPLQPARQRSRGLPQLDTGGWRIDATTQQVRLVTELSSACTAAGGRACFYAAPAYPALYALLRLDAPVYDTFCLYPADAATQAQMIAALQQADVRIAIVSDAPVDNRQDLRFSQTHARVWNHLHAAFVATARPDLGHDVHLFVRHADPGPSLLATAPRVAVEPFRDAVLPE